MLYCDLNDIINIESFIDIDINIDIDKFKQYKDLNKAAAELSLGIDYLQQLCMSINFNKKKTEALIQRSSNNVSVVINLLIT